MSLSNNTCNFRPLFPEGITCIYFSKKETYEHLCYSLFRENKLIPGADAVLCPGASHQLAMAVLIPSCQADEGQPQAKNFNCRSSSDHAARLGDVLLFSSFLQTRTLNPRGASTVA